MNLITVRHNFESAHRMFLTPGKCHGIHGHSFWATVTLEAPGLQPDGTVGVEFGALKKRLRHWMDDVLDHAALLHHEDPLGPILAEHGTKVCQLPYDATTEALAFYIGNAVQQDVLPWVEGASHVALRRVDVQETAVNGAGWEATS